MLLDAELSQPRKNFLRRLLPNAASVVKDQRSRVRRFHLAVSTRKQNSRHLLRVVIIHLTPKRLQKECSARSTRYPLKTQRPNSRASAEAAARQPLQPNVKRFAHLCL